MREKVKIEYSQNSSLGNVSDATEFWQNLASQKSDLEDEPNDEPEEIGPMEARYNE